MKCPECGSNGWNRVLPEGDEISSIESWQCSDCGHEAFYTVSNPIEGFEIDPDDEAIVDTWFESSSPSDCIKIANHIRDPSLNSLSIMRNIQDGRYRWISMPRYQAKQHSEMAIKTGLTFGYETSAQQGGGGQAATRTEST